MYTFWRCSFFVNTQCRAYIACAAAFGVMPQLYSVIMRSASASSISCGSSSSPASSAIAAQVAAHSASSFGSITVQHPFSNHAAAENDYHRDSDDDLRRWMHGASSYSGLSNSASAALRASLHVSASLRSIRTRLAASLRSRDCFASRIARGSRYMWDGRAVERMGSGNEKAPQSAGLVLSERRIPDFHKS